jgi:hypothetical protein
MSNHSSTTQDLFTNQLSVDSFVQGHGHSVGINRANVNLATNSFFDHCSRQVVGAHFNRVEEIVAHHPADSYTKTIICEYFHQFNPTPTYNSCTNHQILLEVQLFQTSRQCFGSSVNLGCDLGQAVWSVINSVSSRHVGQQGLCGADIAGCLVTANVLLSCLHGHTEGMVSMRITTDTDDAAFTKM